MALTNDAAWHAVQLAAICPADTAPVLIDVRNEGTGTTEVRQVALYEVVASPRPGEAIATELSERSFHEIKGGGGWPDYAQLGPGEERPISLGLPATAPRSIRHTYFDLTGRDLEIYIDDRFIQRITPVLQGVNG